MTVKADTITTYYIRYHGTEYETTVPDFAELYSHAGAVVTAETRGVE